MKVCFSEKGRQMRLNSLSCFNSKASHERIHSGIRIHLGRIDVEFLAPHELGLLALVHDGIKETAKDREPIPGPNAAQTGMVRQGLVEIIAEIPANAKAVGRLEHELALGSDALKEHH